MAQDAGRRQGTPLKPVSNGRSGPRAAGHGPRGIGYGLGAKVPGPEAPRSDRCGTAAPSPRTPGTRDHRLEATSWPTRIEGRMRQTDAAFSGSSRRSHIAPGRVAFARRLRGRGGGLFVADGCRRRLRFRGSANVGTAPWRRADERHRRAARAPCFARVSGRRTRTHFAWKRSTACSPAAVRGRRAGMHSCNRGRGPRRIRPAPPRAGTRPYRDRPRSAPWPWPPAAYP